MWDRGRGRFALVFLHHHLSPFVLRDDEFPTRKVICIHDRIDRGVVVLRLCKRDILLRVWIDEPSMDEPDARELEELEFTTKTSWSERRDTGEQWV